MTDKLPSSEDEAWLPDPDAQWWFQDGSVWRALADVDAMVARWKEEPETMFARGGEARRRAGRSALFGCWVRPEGASGAGRWVDQDEAHLYWERGSALWWSAVEGWVHRQIQEGTSPLAQQNVGGREVYQAKGVQFEMAYCPAGRFTVGSPKNEEGRFDDEEQQEVAIAQPFWIGVHPVTQGLYQAVTGENPSYFKGKPDSALRPVEQVSWFDAVRFCNRLSAECGLSPAYEVGKGETPTAKWNPKATGFRLLEEAEWEYAARAGQPFRFSGSDRLEEVGWFAGNSKGETHASGGLKANAWGIHDMSGNVWEWCWNEYDTIYKSSYVLVFSDNSNRVDRGGSWYASVQFARVAFRDRWAPCIRGSSLGFRLARLQGSTGY